MKRYYVNKNKQANGDNEVHENGCNYLAQVRDPDYLGEFTNCRDAVQAAKRKGYNANGCYYCSRPCHTT